VAVLRLLAFGKAALLVGAVVDQPVHPPASAAPIAAEAFASGFIVAVVLGPSSSGFMLLGGALLGAAPIEPVTTGASSLGPAALGGAPDAGLVVPVVLGASSLGSASLGGAPGAGLVVPVVLGASSLGLGSLGAAPPSAGLFDPVVLGSSLGLGSLGGAVPSGGSFGLAAANSPPSSRDVVSLGLALFDGASIEPGAETAVGVPSLTV